MDDMLKDEKSATSLPHVGHDASDESNHHSYLHSQHSSNHTPSSDEEKHLHDKEENPNDDNDAAAAAAAAVEDDEEDGNHSVDKDETEDEEDEDTSSVECPFYIMNASLWSVDKQTKYDLLEGATGKESMTTTSHNSKSIDMTSLSSPAATALPPHASTTPMASSRTPPSFTSPTTSIPATSTPSLSSPSTSPTTELSSGDTDYYSFSSSSSAVTASRLLMGSVISSPSFLKDYNPHETVNKRAYFFAFPDLSVRITGQFRLQFSLIDLARNKIVSDVFSDPFTVYPAKSYPGMKESSPLSKHLAHQGLKLTVRKQIRPKKKKHDR
ncbi:velvet factor-domain-containing protein [Mycotypha africana]|uniref:velvet factor-domain-containing protein n=1 Tax=Mycotypha africana TaxID=64632 RepID=UPI0022FFC6F0|nr:velvet factor-domain-containing protein [Mycotypha africana]KAI8984429.1 velvet factor-domain-containing protein [Mycotypha africana]